MTSRQVLLSLTLGSARCLMTNSGFFGVPLVHQQQSLSGQTFSQLGQTNGALHSTYPNISPVAGSFGYKGFGSYVQSVQSTSFSADFSGNICGSSGDWLSQNCGHLSVAAKSTSGCSGRSKGCCVKFTICHLLGCECQNDKKGRKSNKENEIDFEFGNLVVYNGSVPLSSAAENFKLGRIDKVKDQIKRQDSCFCDFDKLTSFLANLDAMAKVVSSQKNEPCFSIDFISWILRGYSKFLSCLVCDHDDDTCFGISTPLTKKHDDNGRRQHTPFDSSCDILPDSDEYCLPISVKDASKYLRRIMASGSALDSFFFYLERVKRCVAVEHKREFNKCAKPGCKYTVRMSYLDLVMASIEELEEEFRYYFDEKCRFFAQGTSYMCVDVPVTITTDSGECNTHLIAPFEKSSGLTFESHVLSNFSY